MTEANAEVSPPAAAQRLSGRTALVTGAGRGIGAAIATRLGREGAHVIAADIDAEPAEALVAELTQAGASAEAANVDIGSNESVAALADSVKQSHGECAIVVNCAAILDMTPMTGMALDHYRDVININQDGAIRVSLAFLPLIKAAKTGRRIVNIASIIGIRGARECIPYATAKGGVISFTRAAACDLGADGITVNAIAPGFIDTRMAHLPDGSGHEHQTDWFQDIYMKYGRILLGRPGNPDDIAGPAYFFCSDDARYVTGQVLLVDGGVSATF
ncbi:MAG: SDR family oxidoreductase [Hyphomicrobiales bacterium]|nr:SDR family oxidoreductase [Hyphomicrobiales bacterium]